MATIPEQTFYDCDDDSELVVREVYGEHLDERLSFYTITDVPYLDRHAVIELRDFLTNWLERTPI